MLWHFFAAKRRHLSAMLFQRFYAIISPNPPKGEKPMKDKKELLRMLKFTLFSISAGVIEAVSFALLNELTSWSYWPCYLIALVLSVVWNFTLNRRYTFQSAANVPVAMALTLLFYAVFTPLSTILGQYLADKGWNEYLVTGLNMVANFVLEFLWQRFVVYRNHIDDRKK